MNLNENNDDENSENESEPSLIDKIDKFLYDESDNLYELYNKLNYNYPWLINNCSAQLTFFICNYIYEPENITQVNFIPLNKFINKYNDDINSTLYLVNNYFKYNQNKKLRHNRINIELWIKFILTQVLTKCV